MVVLEGLPRYLSRRTPARYDAKVPRVLRPVFVGSGSDEDRSEGAPAGAAFTRCRWRWNHSSIPTQRGRNCRIRRESTSNHSTLILGRRWREEGLHWYHSNGPDSIAIGSAASFSTSPSSSANPTPPTAPSQPSTMPGIALSAITASAGFGVASLISSSTSVALSGIPVSIVLGMAVNNAIGYDRSNFKPGITYATKTILQGGIVAVAAKLSFFELVNAGAAGFPVVLASVGAGMLYIPAAGRIAGLPREMTLLLTAGTSICGVTAITALAPAIKASNKDIAVAVANTVAFGTLGMLTYPYLFHALCPTPEQAGVCLGVAIHDTSQVLGSAMCYKDLYGEEVALKAAAVTKLTRNLGLMVAIPGLSYVHASSKPTSKSDADVERNKTNETISGLVSFQKFVPPFLIAFLGMSALRSIGDYTLASNTSDLVASNIFQQTMDFLGNDVSKCALGTAMAGVGLSTSLDSLKGVGWRPFAVGGSGALVVGGTGFFVSSFVM
ncbi:hypothetical protein ACHAWF_007664 [Thalassiosira exigua]